MAHPGATDPGYTDRLLGYESRWKRLLGVQLPYRWNIRRVTHGKVLDVGCGVGRNLAHLDDAVGVDTNVKSVEWARQRGCTAFTTEEFASRKDNHLAAYDTILFAHILEHMTNQEASDLVAWYLPFLRAQGRIVIVVPQPAGFQTDPTHVEPVGPSEIARIASDNQLLLERLFSFPLPKRAGRWFRHNETVALLRRSGAAA